VNPQGSPAGGLALCTADDATFWPWLSWPKIGAWPNPERTVVVLPLAGIADWGLGHPLDAEETVLMNVIRGASVLAPETRKPLVVPPLRFAFGSEPGCAFQVDQPTAHALIAEVAASIATAGFRKIAIVNASPWSEELCSAAARDLRVSRGLHMFQIHLSAIGLDFHPVRSRSRQKLQTLLTALNSREPESTDLPDAERRAGGWGDESVISLKDAAVSLAKAQIEGATILSDAAKRLAALISDIHECSPLSVTLRPT
jgi:creatinine amidohydrolase